MGRSTSSNRDVAPRQHSSDTLAIRRCPDRDSQPLAAITDTQHVDVGQAASSSPMRVGSVCERGSSDSDDVRHRKIRSAPCRARDLPPQAELRPDPKYRSTEHRRPDTVPSTFESDQRGDDMACACEKDRGKGNLCAHCKEAVKNGFARHNCSSNGTCS